MQNLKIVKGKRIWNGKCPRLIESGIAHACTGLHQGGTWYSLEKCNEIKLVCLDCPFEDCVYERKGVSP